MVPQGFLDPHERVTKSGEFLLPVYVSGLDTRTLGPVCDRRFKACSSDFDP